MPNKRKRCLNTNYKLRYSSYKANHVREKNKAKRITKDIFRSNDPQTTLVKLKPHIDMFVWSYVEAFYNKKKSRNTNLGK